MAESHSEDSPLLGATDPPSPPPRLPPSEWDYDDEDAEKEEKEVSIAKPVRSQTSMDSGCDCGHTEGGLAGPSRSTAPLAQREASLECACDDRRCACATAGDDATTPAEMPKVTFCIEGYEEEDNSAFRMLSSPPGDLPVDVPLCHEDLREFLKGAPPAITFPRVTSYSKSGMLSASSSTASMPMCRICHSQAEHPDTLISPCRCAGTMQFIHQSCLMKWLDVSKSKKTAACELCNYQYNRHKKFKLRHWELPNCSRVDKFLHSVFLLCLIVMFTCATITIYCFKQDRFTTKRKETDLTRSEIVTLTCGVLFFVAFFMAMYVEVKAKDTLYRLFSRFLRINQTWQIDDYDKQSDHQNAPV